MREKENRNRKQKAKIFAMAEIFLMVMTSFAIAFLVSEQVGMASALTTTIPSEADAFTNNGNFVPSGESAGATAGLTTPTTTPAITNNLKISIANPVSPSATNLLSGQKVYNFADHPATITASSDSVLANVKDANGQMINLNGQEMTKFTPNADGTATATVGGTTVNLDKAQASAITANTPGLNSYLQAPYGGYNGITVPGFGKVLVNSPVYGHLVVGLMWSVAAVGAIQLIGSLAGLNSGTTKSLSFAALGGIMTGQLVTGLIQKYSFGSNAIVGAKGPLGLSAGQAGFITGLVVAAAIFILTYKSEKKQLITFQCFPWQAPTGGSSCEKCNTDPFRPCTEYRCRALGQACQLLNPGTGDEKCTWVNPHDVKSPVINPWKDVLSPQRLNLQYIPDASIRPPAIGVKVVSSGNNGCLPAFTPLQFGITTDKPAQCRIDYNHTASYDSMHYYFGGTNYFDYNHTQQMKLPGPDTGVAGDLTPILSNGGQFSLYVRCKDANGNYNVDEYSINFCVDKSPDTTPPIIDGFSIPSGSYVTYNQQTVPIQVYVNKPSDCRFSTQDKAYDNMENKMQCATQSADINANLEYVCSGNLTGIQNRADNNFYFRCKDQPGMPDNTRNVMVQSQTLDIKGSQPLNIINAGPNGTITGSTNVLSVNLTVETSNGAEEGKAICYYSPDGRNSTYLQMFQTNNYQSTQMLNLPAGDYNYYFRCVDAGGNADQSNARFTIFVDNQAPKVTRVYNQDSALKIVTNKNAQCMYSLTTCNYNFNEGIKMIYSNPNDAMNSFAEWKLSNIYYIKCEDAYGNMPDPNQCSLVVSAIQMQQVSSS